MCVTLWANSQLRMNSTEAYLLVSAHILSTGVLLVDYLLQNFYMFLVTYLSKMVKSIVLNHCLV